MSESHLSEVEKTLLYISEARDRADRARTALEAAGAEPHLISALRDTERSLADDHKKLMQRTFFAVPVSDQERLAAKWSVYEGTERSEAQTFLTQLFACYGTDREDLAASPTTWDGGR